MRLTSGQIYLVEIGNHAYGEYIIQADGKHKFVYFSQLFFEQTGGMKFEIPQGVRTIPRVVVLVDEFSNPKNIENSYDARSGIRYSVYLPGLTETTPFEGPSVSTGGTWEIYVRIGRSGRFNSETLEGDFEIEGPYGTQAEFSGTLKGACKLAIDFGDEIAEGRNTTRFYSQARTKVHKALAYFPEFHYGGTPFLVKAERYCDIVFVDGQSFPAHDDVQLKEGLGQKSWAECVECDWRKPVKFYSNGIRIWAEISEETTQSK
jgi:hypothetical protein